jgi:hypothetical protein
VKTRTPKSEFRQSLKDLIGRNVVLDTQGAILYLGRLTEVSETGFCLEDADVHDCTEGHASKELYLIESCHYGIRVNRRRVFVLRSSVLSVSAIDDIVTDISEDRELWSPSTESTRNEAR